jgi:HEAT repeat protein
LQPRDEITGVVVHGQTLARGLGDEDERVRGAALEAVDGLHFPHAFDPLTRIFREHPDPAVKTRVLTSIGRIATVEAGEFLIEVLRHEPDPLREAARRLLWSFDNADIFPILRRHLETESGPARADLEQILRGVSR